MALKDSISKLTELAGQLNKKSDEVTAVIGEYESLIQSTKIGLEAWLDVKLAAHRFDPDPQWEAPARIRYRQLGWAKVLGNWRIVHRLVEESKVWDEHASEEGVRVEFHEHKPLSDAPRTLRLQAVLHLDALVQKLTSEADQLLCDLFDVGFEPWLAKRESER